MRPPTSILAACVLLACRPTHETNAAPSDDAAAAAVPPPSSPAADPLPALPPDLRVAFGEAADAVRSHLRRPKPTLPQPFATSAEHGAWVDRELEPWRQGAGDAAALVFSAQPPAPGDRASADEWKAYDRARFVHTALLVTLWVDEWIVRTELPMPLDLQQDAAAREYLALFLEDAMRSASDWKGTCTWGSDGPLPPELEPWARHCNQRVDALADSVCRAEPRVGLPPSAVCSGARPLGEPPPPASEGHAHAGAMEEIAILSEQVFVVCELAEDVLDDAQIEPAARVRAWRDRFAAAAVDSSEILTLVDDALASREAPASKILAGFEALLHSDPECDALERLFDQRR